MLKMKFVGAIEGVSGSCTWLHHTDSDTQLLVDCGLHQGNARDEWFNSQDFPFEAKRLKYVLLTHAHIDHCGLLPRLVREGFTGHVYATRATRELAEVMLLDAARVSAAFTELEVKQIRWSVLDDDPGFKWGRMIRLAEGLRMAYLRSSHILGACLISIAWKVDGADKSICFSGDIGCQSDDNPYLPLMKSGQNPFPYSNYIVVESTYGGRVRDDQYQCAERRLQRLGEVITHTLGKGGKVLLPAFSLHRTQELMMDVLHWLKFGHLGNEYAHSLRRYNKDHPLVASIHAPLGHAVTQVYAKYLCSKSPNGKFKYLNKELCESLDMDVDALQAMLQRLVEHGSYKVCDGRLMTMVKPKQSLCFESDVVIASAGMCDNGPVVGYLEQWDSDPRNTVILTGYQSDGTRGAELRQRAAGSCGDRAEVVDMSAYYSAHADQPMLLDFIFRMDGYDRGPDATVFLNHGNPDSKYALKMAIEERAVAQNAEDRRIAAVRLADARSVNLDTGEPIDELLEELEALRLKVRQLTE